MNEPSEHDTISKCRKDSQEAVAADRLLKSGARAGIRQVLRIPGLVAILLVRMYQILISPLLGPTCRFHPSCSQYFILAVRKYGLIRGIWKGTARICRCHPWNPGGYDPP